MLGMNDLGQNQHPTLTRGISPKHNPGNSRFKKMTQEEFNKWLDCVDSNHDGYISQKELYAALATLGLNFKRWKIWRMMKRCDDNGNKVIDPGLEREKLIDYAAKHWNIIVTN
jgi:Ca2+-binding EF-hand superfamily protein